MKEKKLDINKILICIIVLPIVLALIIGGGPAIINGFKTIFKAIFPNIWVALAYIYVGVIAFLVGKKIAEKKSQDSEDNEC